MTGFKGAFATRNSVPSVKFTNPGDTVSGTITETRMIQKRDFDTRELVFDDDGQPVEEPVITLETEEGLSLHKNLFVGSWRMLDAIAKACSDFGVEAPEVGGYLTVEFTGYEKAKKGGGRAKTYAAKYSAGHRNIVAGEAIPF